MIKEDKLVKLRELLEEQSTFPLDYTFKFIIPCESIGGLLPLLNNGKISKKESKNGRYLSVTFEKKMKDADSILDIYKKVSDIEGIISI